MVIRKGFPAAMVLAGAIVLLGTWTFACELCGIPPETLREQISNSDVAVIVQRVSGEEPSQDRPGGLLRVKVLRVLKDSRQEKLTSGNLVVFEQFREGTAGELYFIVGGVDKESQELVWGNQLDVSSTAVEYLQHLPVTDLNPRNRVKFYLDFLEHTDDVVGNDAWGEVAGAKYEDMKAVADLFPLDNFRTWLKSSATLETRTGLYALLLGIAGNEADAVLLESLVFPDTEEQPTALSAKLGGYLLLTRGAGLDRIHREIILNPEASAGQLFAALSVYRFLWDYEPQLIPRDKIIISMRKLLHNPQYGNLVINDLSRWKDWDAMEEVVGLFTHPDFSDRTSRQDILRYLTNASEDLPKGESALTAAPAHIVKARDHLARLRKEFPEFTRSAQRFTPD